MATKAAKDKSPTKGATVHIDVRPAGTWIGDQRIKDLEALGWRLICFGTARDWGANESANGMTRYVYYRV